MAEIGSTLREARMRARIDISEVEIRTKIRAKYLRALENEEWDLLPGPVYVKSFLKTYGDFLGLDSRLLVDEFKRRYERPSDHEARLMATTARERDRRRSQPSRMSSMLFSPRSVIVVALAVIVVALWLIGNQTSKNSTNGTVPTPQSTTGGSGKHRAGGAGTHAGGGSQRGATTTNTGTTRTQTTPVVKNATLRLVPTSNVWICVENQAGKPLMAARDYAAGESIPTLTARQMLITLGNTSVTMTADGKPYPLSGGAVTSLRVTPQGVTTSATAAKCTG
jgi:cytoskeletal protein RodZ